VGYAGCPGAKTKISQPTKRIPLVGLDGRMDVISVSEEDGPIKLTGDPALTELLRRVRGW
jgi:hypothetical protein